VRAPWTAPFAFRDPIDKSRRKRAQRLLGHLGRSFGSISSPSNRAQNSRAWLAVSKAIHVEAILCTNGSPLSSRARGCRRGNRRSNTRLVHMVHMDYTLKSYGIWMMEGELEVHMDRMDQMDRLPAAAGHVAMPASRPSAAMLSEPRAPYPMPDGRSRHRKTVWLDRASRTGRPPVASLNSCHLEISGERRSALAALLGTLPEQEPSKMRQVMRNVMLCLIATWIANPALTSSAQAATFGSSEWWQQMDSDGRGGRGG
jgi:hypothetical protein